MNGPHSSMVRAGAMLEIIAFRLHDQEFCVRTTTIREIRGWGPATPIPHAPQDVLGVMNLRGMVIPIIDLANKLGMKSTEPSPRSAVRSSGGLAVSRNIEGMFDKMAFATSKAAQHCSDGNIKYGSEHGRHY